jgi:hypothetical protein
MALPLVPFAAGAAIGAAAIYGWKDPELRDQFSKGGQWLYDTTAGLLGSMFGVVKPVIEEAAETVEAVAEAGGGMAAAAVEALTAEPAPAPKPRARRPKAVARTAAPKRAPARKAPAAEAPKRPRRRKTEE